MKIKTLPCLFLAANLLFASECLALDLQRVKIPYLVGDYKTAIDEGESMLAGSKEDAAGLDELYYTLGLAYLKDGRYLRASDIFEIILKEFKESKFKDEAKMGLGDSYFLRGDYSTAQAEYMDLLKKSPKTGLRPLLYYRISQSASKLGNTQEAQDYLNKLRQEAPLNLEEKPGQYPEAAADFYYTVQVGTFSKSANANNLKNKLTNDGYPAYLEELIIKGKVSYRVRVGKVRQRQEALDLEKKLSRQGYPTKIFP